MTTFEQFAATSPSVWPYVESRHGPVPAVPVGLAGPKGGGTTIGYVDSGAATTAVPVEFAERLGIDLERADGLIAYAGGQAVEYKRATEPVAIEIAGRVIELEPVFGDFEHLLIGRDVFAHFRVTFDERAGHVILDPYAEEVA
jgi:hypothetical protein